MGSELPFVPGLGSGHGVRSRRAMSVVVVGPCAASVVQFTVMRGRVQVDFKVR